MRQFSKGSKNIPIGHSIHSLFIFFFQIFLRPYFLWRVRKPISKWVCFCRGYSADIHKSTASVYMPISPSEKKYCIDVFKVQQVEEDYGRTCWVFKLASDDCPFFSFILLDPICARAVPFFILKFFWEAYPPFFWESLMAVGGYSPGGGRQPNDYTDMLTNFSCSAWAHFNWTRNIQEECGYIGAGHFLVLQIVDGHHQIYEQDK